MNNKIRIIIISFISVFLFQGLTCCQKASINGDLDGRWQILEIENSGEVEYVKDKQLYYNFYMHVCNLSFYGGIFTEANFHYNDNLITLDFPYIDSPEKMDKLKEYGIYSTTVEFNVVYLDNKKLIMQNDESVITLRKF